MSDRLKSSGFWTFRFLVTPKEMEIWTDHIINRMEMTINLEVGSGFDVNQVPLDTVEPLIEKYREFYDSLMSPHTYEQSAPFFRAWLTKDGFNCPIHFQIDQWYFDPYHGKRVSRDFYIRLVCPKGYQVNDHDGKHYDYHDIHEKEPAAKQTFAGLISPLKKIAKLLYVDRYGTGKLIPDYQIRISKQAWADLVDSAFYLGPGERLSTKW